MNSSADAGTGSRSFGVNDGPVRCAVVGGGAWGTAIADRLARNGLMAQMKSVEIPQRHHTAAKIGRHGLAAVKAGYSHGLFLPVPGRILR